MTDADRAPGRTRVHYLGSYDQDYARHRVLQGGLRRLGIELTETRDQGFLPSRWWRLSRALLTSASDETIIVGESGNFLTPVLLAAAIRHRPIVFDTFVSLGDTWMDRHSGLARRALPAFGRAVDWLNCRASSLVLVDTRQNHQFFVDRIGVSPTKLEVVYVGAETDLFVPSPLRSQGSRPLRVVFYGTFIPLHGVDIVLKAAARLQLERAHITIQLVGMGQDYGPMRRLARELGLANVAFGPGRVEYSQLPQLIGSADVCLGIFADRAKTSRVIPHKVFQSAACGRPVITADTPAIREIFSEQTLALVAPGDPVGLANELLALADDFSRRRDLAERSSTLVRETYSPEPIARRLMMRLRGT